jgi:serine/threonine protein phosphatase 1
MTLIIGDIHGCYDELQALLDKAGIGDDEPIIALGDVVDRGAASPQTLLFLQQRPLTQVLMGNHERKHVRHARGELKLATSQRITIAQYAERNLDYAAAVDYMASLPLYLELPEAILVHGYLEPDVPLPQQRATVLAGTMGGDNYLTKQYGRPWYQLYQGTKPVIVGHHNYNGSDVPFVYRDLIYGLDTSVYAGKTLTGLLLPQFRLVSVPAKANHWRNVLREYRSVLPQRRPSRPVPPETLSWPRLAAWLKQAANQSDPSSTQQAERARVEQIVAEAQAVLLQLPAALTTLFAAEQSRLVRDVPDYDRLTPREQGRTFDTFINHHPPLVRQMLHRLRQGQAIETIVAEALRSPAEVLAVWSYLSPDEQAEL